MNVVILEDEGVTALFLQETLTALGHNVVKLFSRGEALIRDIEYTDIAIDLLFMDINIRGNLNGIETSEKVRTLLESVEIVFITSYKDSDTIKKAQNVKPSGYMIKPVNKNDIEAMLMVIETKLDSSSAYEIKLTDLYTFNMKNLTLKGDSKEIKLTNNELLCLQKLIKAKNSYITSQELIETIWQEELNTNRGTSLRELMARLRRKIPDIPITNNYKVGYKLTLR